MGLWQWRSQDFPRGGGGIRTRLKAHCVRKGPTKVGPIFFNAGLQTKKTYEPIQPDFPQN